jgi:predicted ester cyclase
MHDNAAIVRQFIDETLNQGDIEGAARFVWEDVVEQVPFPGQGPGLAGLRDVLRAMRAAFPDLHWSVEEQMTDGDRVLTRFEWTGTHRGPFLGWPSGAWSSTGLWRGGSRTRGFSWTPSA